MNTYNITELHERKIEICCVETLNMTLAKDIDTGEVFAISSIVIEPEKKKPGPKKKYPGVSGRPPKNSDYVPGSKSKDFLTNDTVTTLTDEEITQEFNDMEKTRQKILRKEI